MGFLTVQTDCKNSTVAPGYPPNTFAPWFVKNTLGSNKRALPPCPTPPNLIVRHCRCGHVSCNVVCKPLCQFVISVAPGLARGLSFFKKFHFSSDKSVSNNFRGDISAAAAEWQCSGLPNGRRRFDTRRSVLRQPPAPAHLGKSHVFDSGGCSAAVLQKEEKEERTAHKEKSKKVWATVRRWCNVPSILMNLHCIRCMSHPHASTSTQHRCNMAGTLITSLSSPQGDPTQQEVPPQKAPADNGNEEPLDEIVQIEDGREVHHV